MAKYEISKVTNMQTHKHTHMDVCVCICMFIKWTRTENKTKHTIHLDKSELQKKLYAAQINTVTPQVRHFINKKAQWLR